MATVCIERGCIEIAERGSRCTEHTAPAWSGSQRKARLANRSGSAEQRRAQRIIKRYGGICHVCRQPGADQADHVIALSEGGADTEANMRPIHARPCHASKTAAEAARARARQRR